MNRNRNRSCLARGVVKPSALCRMGKTDYFRGQAKKQTFALLLVIALTWIRLGIDRLRGKKKPMLVMAKKVTKLDLPAPKVTVSKYVVDDIQTGHWALLYLQQGLER